MQDLLEAPSSPTTGTQSLLLLCPGAAGAGRQDLGSSPRNTVTDPDSEREQPCLSCGCFPERSDLALSKIGTPRNRWNSEITCFPFAQFQVFLFSFSFLRMSLIAPLAHFLVWATFNVRKTHRKVNTHNIWIVRQLSKELNVLFSVLLSINLQVLKLKYLFLIKKKKKLPSLGSFNLSTESELCGGHWLEMDLWLKQGTSPLP